MFGAVSEVLIVLTGDLNLEVTRSSAFDLFAGTQLFEASQNNQSPSTPSLSLFQRKRVIDWVFTRGPIHTSHPKVHSSASDSDHYPLSGVLSFA
jgi:endonuclease/exonuclease/phosphatase family metal-dependent hydrolase